MANKTLINETQARWDAWCKQVRTATPAVQESEAQKNARIVHLRKNYAAFVEYYFPHYCLHPASGALIKTAAFQVREANYLLANGNAREVLKWARGHAKSTTIDVFIPLWLKAQRERQLDGMVLVGKSEDSAVRLLSDVQAELQSNERYIADYGVQYRFGHWEEGEFGTQDGCFFAALGRGQSPRGLRERERRPNYIAVDDLDDDELVRNPDRVNKMTDWVSEALFGVLGAAGGRFVMVGNLIAKNSVLAKIAEREGVRVSQVNIYDKNGKPSWNEYWSAESIKEAEQFMGYRSFQKEYMNNPITEGAVFRQDWIRWKKALPLNKYEHLIAYCDPSFKSGTKNDYKAIKVWGKAAAELHNLRNFVRQCSVSEMVRWFYDLHEEMQKYSAICDYYIEANFLQDILLDEFTREGEHRGYQIPIRADHRAKGDKFGRIEAVSPLWERGFVWYNEAMQKDRDTLAGLDQLLAFEKGSRAHDDAPDADEGAIYLLQKRARTQNFEPRIGHRMGSRHGW